MAIEGAHPVPRQVGVDAIWVSGAQLALRWERGVAKQMQPAALIVDDSPFVRAIIRHHLIAAGFTVVGEAENAEDGLRLFRELRPNLVTLDVMMPLAGEIDSLAAFREMKKENPEIVVVVVSVLPFEKVRENFLKEGAIAYITKPFNQYSFEPVRQRLSRIFPQLNH